MKRFILIALICGFATTSIVAQHCPYEFNRYPIGHSDITSLKYLADKILDVNGVKYQMEYEIPDDSVFWNWADTAFKDVDTTVYPGYMQWAIAYAEFFNQKAQLETISQSIRYGFIESDLKRIWPEIGTSNTNIIPVLVEAIKDLKKQLQVLNMQVKDYGVINGIKDDQAHIPYLYQNNPNPFSESTTIKFYIPDNTSSACMRIYDMVGSELMKINIADKGYSSISFQGKQLKAGMYLYSLIVDDKEVDTKRMILTAD